MVASTASPSVIVPRKARYRGRKSCASAGSEEVPFSLDSIFQVAKSARARVSARLAISLSGDLIKMAGSSATIPSGVARYQQQQPQHRAGGSAQYRGNNIKI